MRKVFRWSYNRIHMVRYSPEKQLKILEINSLQNTILSETSCYQSKRLSLQASTDRCWELTEQVRHLADRSRTLWQQDDTGKTTTNTITKEKLRAHLENYSMDSYLRMLYYALCQQDDDESYPYQNGPKAHWI